MKNFLLLLLLPVVVGCAAPVRAAVPVADPVNGLHGAQSVDQQLADGRARLEEGQLTEALALFESAEKQDPTIKTRQWVLRAWIAQGRVNDALNQIDALAKGGAKGPAMDYLYGMAFAQKAKGYIGEGVSGGIVAMAFTDAVDFLKGATKAEPDLYRDAFLPLAESAWYGGDLETARAAAEKALAARPQDGDAAMVLGRIAFSQYTSLRDETMQKQAAEATWIAARDAFTKAAELYAAAPDAAARAKGAGASMQIGWLHVWKGQGDEAAKSFGPAAGLDPASVDFAQLRESLTGEQFVAALEEALKTHERVNAADKAGDASLQWWLGYGRYGIKRYEEAEAAFTRAVTEAPAFMNSWYYIALSRYFRQDYDGTIAALRTHYGLSADDAVASLRSNPEENLRTLDYLIGLKAARAANLDAGFLSELQVGIVPDGHRYWNNLGLFLRDEAEAREQRQRDMSPEERKQVMDLYERAYIAYLKSLELSPDDPNYLNDTALMLHYHLDRDLDQARAWYVKSAERAQAELERKDMSSDLRALRELALRDSKDNLAKLDRLLERRKQEKEKKGSGV